MASVTKNSFYEEFSAVINTASLPTLVYETRCKGDFSKSLEILSYARMHSTTQAEAYLIEGLDALENQNAEEAYLSFWAAHYLNPQNMDIISLIAKSLAKDRSQQCQFISALETALQKAPLSSQLWIAYWEALTSQHNDIFILENILKRLPFATGEGELAKLSELLVKNPFCPRFVGCATYDVQELTLKGWAVDFFQIEKAPHIKLVTNDGLKEIQLSRKSPFAKEIHKEFNFFTFEEALLKNTDVEILFEDGTRFLGNYGHNPKKKETFIKSKKSFARVDVIIPVYGAFDETLLCLKSLIKTRDKNKTLHEIIIIDDASPNQNETNELEQFCKDNHLLFIRQTKNCGFIETVNLGMRLNKDRDIILLNSDCCVSGNWIDRLRAHVMVAKDIASITPLTNNGELLSFPKIKKEFDFPGVRELRFLDDAAAKLSAGVQEIPSGCGFCFYMTRQAIESVGLFDEKNYTRGYGEETDWCLRAQTKGFRHLAALDVFVAHAGQGSFGIEKISLAAHNNRLIRLKFPQAERIHKDFIKADPLSEARKSIQREWLLSEIKNINPSAREIILHNETRVFLSTQKPKLGLSYISEGANLKLRLYRSETSLPCESEFILPRDHEALKVFMISLKPKKLLAAFPQDIPKILKECLTKISLSISKETINPPQLNYRSIDENKSNIFVIADKIDNKIIGQKWQRFLQTLAQIEDYNRIEKGNLVKFILLEETPWLETLKATGLVYRIDTPEGLTLAQHLKFCGVRGFISLETNLKRLEINNWSVVFKAKNENLPLFALKNSELIKYGAKTIESLNLKDSNVRRQANG